ncbi:MAG: hypothetical protein U5N53_28360 [Mycobacterium sp.]|nr:hypothetical protein [Mycobacterium sp.]
MVARGWSLLTDAAWTARLHVRTGRRNLRWWWSGPTVEELTARAAWELATNPTITVYTFDGGVEQRRPGAPWLAVRAAMDSCVDALAQLTVGVCDFSDTLRRAMFDGVRLR